jgi:hypothetical protein
MRRIKRASHAHIAMRAQGRTPGDEGRTAIPAYRQAQARSFEMRDGKISKEIVFDMGRPV